MVWSDGLPLVAQHFVDSWIRLLDPASGAVYAYYLFPIRGARAFNAGESPDPGAVGVRALDDATLEVEHEAPLGFFPALVNFVVIFPIRLDVIARHGERWTEPGNLVSLGPYVLEAWRHDYRIALRARSRASGTRGAPERIVFYMVSDPATSLVLFEQGQLDLVRLPPLEIRRYIGTPEHRSTLQLYSYYYGFDTRQPPFDDARVRRAFAMALGRDALVAVLREGSTASDSWLPPGMPAANLAIGVHLDPAAARALLREAGVDAASLEPIALGLAAGMRRGSALDRAIVFSTLIGVSLPSFVLGAALMLGVGLYLGWLPAGLWEGPAHAILPALTLAALPLAYVAQLTRAQVIEVAGRDHVRTARAKGLGEGRVRRRHVLRNALLAVVTYFGPVLALLLTGSFVVEKIFAIPGMGGFFVSAVTDCDYPVVLGITLLYAALVVLWNLVVDLLYAWLDPRIRFSERNA